MPDLSFKTPIIPPESVNANRLSGIDLIIQSATQNRVQRAQDLFADLYAARNALDNMSAIGITHEQPPFEQPARATKSPAPQTSGNIDNDENNDEQESPEYDLKTPAQFLPAYAMNLLPDDLKNTRFKIWKTQFPEVPKINENYRFEGPALAQILRSIIMKDVLMITGPTGSGKTSIVEQVAAHLNRPCFVIQVDGEIRRAEVIGHFMQKPNADGSGSHTEWQDGLLLQAMKYPSILCLDEMDQADPDLTYALHRVMDRPSYVLLEEAKTIHKHPEMTIITTANTKGLGDATGTYNTRTFLSEATRGRIIRWTTQNYLSESAELELIQNQFPKIPKDTASKLAVAIKTLQNLFTTNSVQSACSTRQTLAAAAGISFSISALKSANRPINRNKILAEEITSICLERYPDNTQLAAAIQSLTNKLPELADYLPNQPTDQ